MKYVDPDQPNEELTNQLIKYWEDAAKRQRQLILKPPGSSDSSREFNQARASSILNQCRANIADLKQKSTRWTSAAMRDGVARGLKVADEQAAAAGIRPDAHLQGSFSVINQHAVELIARDTLGDLNKAADSMFNSAGNLLRRMAATGVSNAQVNQILAGRYFIEGQPQQAISELREALKVVHGNRVLITDKNGDQISFKTGYYAQMVARSKGHEVARQTRHARLQARGIDLVKIVGNRTINPCSLLLGHIFSLSGTSSKYPAYSTVSKGQLPWKLYHPNCTKGTAPYVTSYENPDESTAKEAA